MAFSVLVVWSIWLFYHGYAWLVGSYTTVFFVVVALSHEGTWPERITAACSLPFVAFGGWGGYVICRQLFSFAWFAAVFGGKGVGPLVLVLFVGGFAILGGALGVGLLAASSSCVTRFWQR